jgi:hypothetical protein
MFGRNRLFDAGPTRIAALPQFRGNPYAIHMDFSAAASILSLSQQA